MLLKGGRGLNVGDGTVPPLRNVVTLGIGSTVESSRFYFVSDFVPVHVYLVLFQLSSCTVQKVAIFTYYEAP